MLVESGSGKSGRAFEYVMEAPEEGDFVLIGNNGHVVTRKGPPRRLSESTRSESNLSDVAKKVREAEERRAEETAKKKRIARRHNNKVDVTLTKVQQLNNAKFWELDNKLRAADRRREDIVAQIRARAQEHSAHVVLVKKSNVVKSKVLDAQIATCLIRAAENRAALIRQTQNRIAVDNARKEKIRKTQAEGAARASMDAFWELDRKLQSAARRRKSHVEEIKERAQSPTDKAAAIREINERRAEIEAEKLSAKLEAASVKRTEKIQTLKERSKVRTQKVVAVNMEKERRATTIDSTTSLKLLRANENRQRKLDIVRRRQAARAAKAERVRQTKRVIAAADNSDNFVMIE